MFECNIWILCKLFVSGYLKVLLLIYCLQMTIVISNLKPHDSLQVIGIR